jgi:hypothetical protein
MLYTHFGLSSCSIKLLKINDSDWQLNVMRAPPDSSDDLLTGGGEV